MSELSGQQLRILRSARAYVAEYGEAPSVRELATAVELSSPSTIAFHLRRMRAQGVVVDTRGRPQHPVPQLRSVRQSPATGKFGGGHGKCAVRLTAPGRGA